MEHLEQKFVERKATPETVIEERERPGGYKVREFIERSEEKYPERLEIHDIEYETPSGEIFRFKQLLPDGWRLFRTSGNEKVISETAKSVYYGDRYLFYKEYIVPGGEILPQAIGQETLRRFVDPKNRRVVEYASPKQIECKGFFLGLLHELGHVHIFENEKIAEEERQKNWGALKIINQKRRKGLALSQEEIAFYQRFIIKTERNAWAWALRELRKLRHSGIDLEPELQSPKKIFSAIRGVLKTHHWGNLSEQEFNEAWRAALYIEDKSVEHP